MRLYHYKATDIEVVDGDTLEATVHLGFHLTKRIRVRIEGIDAPELRGAEKLEGQESKRALEEMLYLCEPEVLIHTFKGKSFDRWRASVTAVVREGCSLKAGRVYFDEGDSVSVGDWMTRNGFARMAAK